MRRGDLVFVPQHRLCWIQRHEVNGLRLEPPPLKGREEDFVQEVWILSPEVVLPHQPVHTPWVVRLMARLHDSLIICNINGLIA